MYRNTVTPWPTGQALIVSLTLDKVALVDDTPQVRELLTNYKWHTYYNTPGTKRHNSALLIISNRPLLHGEMGQRKGMPGSIPARTARSGGRRSLRRTQRRQHSQLSQVPFLIYL